MHKTQLTGSLSALKQFSWVRSLHPVQLLPRLMAGLVVGLIIATIAISYAALIFSGDLSVHRAAGIGFTLFTALAAGVVVALTNSFPAAAVKPQDTPAAILAGMAAAMAAAIPASAGAEHIFATVVAALVLASLTTGLFFFGVGWFRLGNLVRYIPYPVMGGYMAGIGWLLTLGSIRVMVDTPAGFSPFVHLFQADLLWQWLPGCLAGLALLLLVRRFRHALTIPAALLASVILFYLVLWLAGMSPVEAGAAGWLLGPFSNTVVWRPPPLALWSQVNWPVLLGQIGGVGTIVSISVMDLLLCASGLELVSRRDVDLNRELRAAGIGNLLAGLGGGIVGFQTQSLSTLGYRIGGASRLVGLVAALTCGAVLFFGMDLLAYLPKPVLGGVLFFLGLNYLTTWIYDAWFKLPKVDYAILWLILLSINLLGMLESIGLGMMVTIVLFVVRYSHIDMIKHVLSGRTYRSTVDRPLAHRVILCQQGERLFILRLQGFLFFGTTHRLLEQVRRRVKAAELPTPRFILLDLGHVRGVDGSALLGLTRLIQFARGHGIKLLFTHLHGLEVRLERALGESATGDWRVFPDLDRGVEWCEEQLLSDAQVHGIVPGCPGDDVQVAEFLRPALQQQMERRTLDPGHYLIHQGDPPQGIFFVERGRLTAQLEYENGRSVRLRRMGPGAIVGEIGLYTGAAASASVIANRPSSVLYLSAEKLDQLAATDPESVTLFHRAIARLVSQRLLDATATMRSLLA